MRLLVPADFPYAIPAGGRFDSARSYSFASKRRQLHEGMDFAPTKGAPKLLPVLATQDGEIVKTGWDARGYGNFIIIDHGDGWRTWLAHFVEPPLKKSGRVSMGEIVGYAGSTGGTSTGVHVHLTVQHIPFGARNYVVDYVVDPEPLLIKQKPLIVQVAGVPQEIVRTVLKLSGIGEFEVL